MGWYLRKSVKFGPLRVNFSKSGIGYSFGVKGARIGTGPRGPYIAGGRYGLYYRQSLKAHTHPPRTVPARPIIPVSSNAYCSHCGAPIAADSDFCTQCGAPVSALQPATSEAAHAYCTHCGAAILAGNQFCIECGAAIHDPEKHDHHLSWWLLAGGILLGVLFLRLLGS